MIQAMLWVLFGMLGGWIGYLASRQTRSDSSTHYLVIGTLSSVFVGLATKNIGVGAQSISINPYSLLLTLIVSTMCVTVFGLVRNVNGSH